MIGVQVELQELNQRLDGMEQRIMRLEAGSMVPAKTAARNGAVTVDLPKARLTGFEERLARLETQQHE